MCCPNNKEVLNPPKIETCDFPSTFVEKLARDGPTDEVAEAWIDHTNPGGENQEVQHVWNPFRLFLDNRDQEGDLDGNL